MFPCLSIKFMATLQFGFTEVGSPKFSRRPIEHRCVSVCQVPRGVWRCNKCKRYNPPAKSRTQWILETDQAFARHFSFCFSLFAEIDSGRPQEKVFSCCTITHVPFKIHEVTCRLEKVDQMSGKFSVQFYIRYI